MTLSPKNKEILPTIIAIDLDGVVYTGNHMLPGASEAIKTILTMGFHIVYVTNNSGKTRKNIAEKLKSMNIEASEENVLNSGYAAAQLIKRLSGGGSSKVMVIGTDDLKEEITCLGLDVVERCPCEFVLAGLDPGFNYQKIADSLDALNNGSILIACNRDKSYPIESGKMMPGCGPIVSALENAWGRQAKYEVGKPGIMLLEMIANDKKVGPEEILVVGDSIESDIAMAKAFGSPSVLIHDISVSKNINSNNQVIVLRALNELPALLQQMISGKGGNSE